MLNFITLQLVGAELFHADGWTDKHEEANSRFSCNFVNVPKNSKFCPHSIYICFVRRSISEQRANFALYNVQRLLLQSRGERLLRSTK